MKLKSPVKRKSAKSPVKRKSAKSPVKRKSPVKNNVKSNLVSLLSIRKTYILNEKNKEIKLFEFTVPNQTGHIRRDVDVIWDLTKNSMSILKRIAKASGLKITGVRKKDLVKLLEGILPKSYESLPNAKKPTRVG